jgi:apolipoprotein N-acyltransferase
MSPDTTTVDDAVEAAAAPEPPAPVRPLLSRPPALAAAVAGGAAMLVSFPNPNLWWLAPVAVALIALATHRRGLRGGFGLGALAGLVTFVPLLHWTNIVGGAVPWLLLAGLQALYIGLLGAASAWVSPLLDRYAWMWPPITGALWVGQEALRDRTPFGGFPWGRLAFSQADSPLLRYAVLGGAPLVTFVTAVAGGLLALGAVLAIRRRPAVRTAAVAIGAVAVFVLGLAVPTSAPTGRAIQVAIIQGNVPRLGLEFNAQRRAVLDNHVLATEKLAVAVRNGTAKQPDIVIWPENSSDIDPLVTDDPNDADAAAAISGAANLINAPILVGAVLEGPGTHARNAAIVWTPMGLTGSGGPQSGPHGIYVKQHPVPFAEYVPLRSIARKISAKVDLIRADFVAGHTPGVLVMPAAGGPVTVGDAICFEVAYDNIVHTSVTGGAQILTVQTNNADFNPAEARQQLAMVRLRAVESGRDALMVSTVGISAFVDASGAEHNTTGFNVAATEVRQLHLGNQRTLAVRLGELPEFAFCAAALAALAGAAWLRRRAGKAAASPSVG